MAEAELDVEEYVAAESAADRALAADPNNYRALIYKGRARMALARKQPDKANWTEIRSWFLRANKVDPEGAEPLMQYYNAYLYSGARPTRNAIDGLLYALAIAPNDNRLRIVAVRQLLFDGRIADARRYFAPLAFAPHAKQKWREATVKVMTALDGSDRKSAITSLDEAEKVLTEGS